MTDSTLQRPAAPGGTLTNAVLDFRPSRHGFHFRNRFPPTVTARLAGGGSESMGLCGGMVFTVRDLFERRIDPPPDVEAPARGTRRFTALFRRQVESFDWLRLPVRFWILSALHRDPPTWWSRIIGRTPLGEHTRATEWPRIRVEIDAGRLAQIGVVRVACSNPFQLTRNHQVLGYGYRVEPDLISVRVYDPNWPDRDDVELRVEMVGARAVRLTQSTGEPLHGFFLTQFTPAPPRAWMTQR
jgi:hypothetical protein